MNNYPQSPQTNSMALAGFIVSLVCCGPLGLILSAIGLSQINKDPNQGGKGFAIAGIVIGIVGIVAAIFYIVFIVAIGASDTSSYNGY